MNIFKYTYFLNCFFLSDGLIDLDGVRRQSICTKEEKRDSNGNCYPYIKAAHVPEWFVHVYLDS